MITAMPDMLKNLLTVLTAVVISFAAIEIGLRTIGYDPLKELKNGREAIIRISDIPGLEYELTPNASAYAWNTEVKINSLGFRDREFSEQKSRAYRILALGDSITFGTSLAVDLTYPKQLEELLNEAGSARFEVFNLGVGGY